MTKIKLPRPDGQDGQFAARIWHWRLKKYLYAKDYGLMAFPLGSRGK